MKFVRSLFRYFYPLKDIWVELAIVPPVVVVFCYLVYGGIFFSSPYVFGALILPWIFFATAVSVQCNWWRLRMHLYFVKLEDWWKRLIFSILGYISIHVLCFCVIFIALKGVWIEEVSFVNQKLHILILLDFSTLIVITTLYEGVTFFEKWKEAITETEQLEKLNLESQFRSLQSQLNPHFLFNSFNVLSSLITENPRRAEDFVDELSNVYRYLLRTNNQELATVEEELRFIRSFFHLLETRHDKGIALKINVGPESLKRQLPSLALQILVENAVKHNEISPERPLLIEIFEKNGTQLIINNNVQAKKTRMVSNHVGLSNLKERYKLLGIEGFEVRADGQWFEVVLPLI
jgi:sensor histidine kinase YesM